MFRVIRVVKGCLGLIGLFRVFGVSRVNRVVLGYFGLIGLFRVKSFDTMWLFIINGGHRSFIRLSFANKQLMETDRCPTQELL